MTEDVKGYEPQSEARLDPASRLDGRADTAAYRYGTAKLYQPPPAEYRPRARVAELEMALKAIRVILKNARSSAYDSEARTTISAVVAEALHDAVDAG